MAQILRKCHFDQLLARLPLQEEGECHCLGNFVQLLVQILRKRRFDQLLGCLQLSEDGECQTVNGQKSIVHGGFIVCKYRSRPY